MISFVINCDLNNTSNQSNYIRKYRPFVTIMAPTCTPYGPMSQLVRHMSPSAWKASLHQARPHGKFCGSVASLVNELNLYFLAEQPHPSELWKETEWSIVFKNPSAKSVVIHQCAADQRGPEGGFAKKPTRFVSNSEAL